MVRGCAFTFVVLLPVFTLSAQGDTSVTFNRDILPILSNNCFACHGPDEHARKAKLRLDVEDLAKTPLPSGATPIVPGDAEASAVMQRITSVDPEYQMPPPDSGKLLTDQQRERIRQWIAEGAVWQTHWAFIPPQRPALPVVRNTSWARNPIDYFVLARLEAQGFQPSPEADRYTLIRRASLALTGLPPSPAEIQQFVDDPDPLAYDALVDRLLASPRYGEHMARDWLDLARYADTNGYAADIARTMWRYRDWVIGAYNANMPFDRFTIEQLAGDLQESPTLAQRIATGFNRNHPIMMEGGAIFEEYRVMNVVDRVNTTATTWLGLTMGCAQCHDHKYDPISQREFYELYAFFNNIAEEESRLFGTELDGNSVPSIKAPLPEQQAELDRIDAALHDVRTRQSLPIASIDAAQQLWEASERVAITRRWIPIDVSWAPATTPDDPITLTGETGVRNISAIRFEVLPEPTGKDSPVHLAEIELYMAPIQAGAVEARVSIAESVSASGAARAAYDGDPNTTWHVTQENDTVAVFALASPAGFAEGTRVRLIVRGSGLGVSRVRLSISNDPRFFPAQLGPWYVNGPYVANTGDEALSTQHVDPNNIDLAATYDDGRAKWTTLPGGLPDGVAHSLGGRTCATYFHRNIVSPAPRRMNLALDNRNAVRLWVNGRILLDKEAQRGEVEAHPAPVQIELREGDNRILIKVVDYYDFNSHTFFFARKSEEVGPLPLSVEAALLGDVSQRPDEELALLRTYYRSRYWDEWAALHEQELDLLWSRDQLDKRIPTTMVMEELDTPRQTHVLIRGQYDQPGDEVSPGVPAALHRWPATAPKNRLGLAQWIVSSENPLTARVTINRFWQRVWGNGLVHTPEDFGVQGDRPVHQALLDWLACEFIDSGWDVKAMQRLIVTSAAFRQSSRIRPEDATHDPENRLFARGPRFRLDAEVIRDSGLAMSGLLVEQIGGPSVKPYQPPGLWRDVAYGGGGQRYTAQEFIQDHGDSLYRRSLYTFWKRAAAPPGMLLFDAPNREVCTARRSRSNTPLQVLALMNDVQYVEVARAMAQRVMNESGPGPQERIRHASLLALGRPASPREERALLHQFNEQLADYRADLEGARDLLRTGESPYDTKLDCAELAAWTLVASSLLNSDGALSQF